MHLITKNSDILDKRNLLRKLYTWADRCLQNEDSEIKRFMQYDKFYIRWSEIYQVDPWRNA